MTLRTEHTPEVLADAVGLSRNWTDLIRRLGRESSAGLRKQLQKLVAEYGIDVTHFTQQSPWKRYTDEALTEAVARSRSLREVALALGAVPASGTLSHLSRRITALGLSRDHFISAPQTVPELDLARDEIAAAAAAARSMRELARQLGLEHDSASRKVLKRAVETHGIDTSHFKRRSTDLPPQTRRGRSPEDLLSVLGPGSARRQRKTLHRALNAKGVPYACSRCGNPGEWQGEPMTLQIDHINGDWHDNRLENLRYLCPNCHALTETWCGAGRRTRRIGT